MKNVKLSALLMMLAALGCDQQDATDDIDTDIDTDTKTECENNVCIVSGTITENLTMTADVSWLLRGGVFIGDDVNETVLTIEPGTKIYGESATDGMLIITRNSKIMANGTADAPIVMTSSVGRRISCTWRLGRTHYQRKRTHQRLCGR